jgi:Fe2+ transport system protein FeoA
MERKRIALMKCTDLAIGQLAVVTRLDEVEPLLRRRLNSMGFHEGTKMYVHNKSIWGGPLTISYQKQVISLRKADAARIGVALA